MTEEEQAWMESIMPPAVRELPRDARSYPIPWFVYRPPQGPVDLRIADGEKRRVAFRNNLCWVCGSPLGRHRVFLAGPKSIACGGFSDWCCHEACAVFSAIACPFVNGRMSRRREGGTEGTMALPGHVATRPPTMGLYYVAGKITLSPHGHFLSEQASRIEWYANGERISEAEAKRINQEYEEASDQ